MERRGPPGERASRPADGSPASVLISRANSLLFFFFFFFFVTAPIVGWPGPRAVLVKAILRSPRNCETACRVPSRGSISHMRRVPLCVGSTTCGHCARRHASDVLCLPQTGRPTKPMQGTTSVPPPNLVWDPARELVVYTRRCPPTPVLPPVRALSTVPGHGWVGLVYFGLETPAKLARRVSSRRELGRRRGTYLLYPRVGDAVRAAVLPDPTDRRRRRRRRSHYNRDHSCFFFDPIVRACIRAGAVCLSCRLGPRRTSSSPIRCSTKEPRWWGNSCS